ncbi:hypothetical protein G8764_06790 [Pseudomaricurvus alcaniphilus]|nr:hypothetical protein [Pseudomaricurvus alcaniphilus]NHN36991.1 hypothetical protein [Pseudomaricurvus alcaniphilus]
MNNAAETRQLLRVIDAIEAQDGGGNRSGDRRLPQRFPGLTNGILALF